MISISVKNHSLGSDVKFYHIQKSESQHTGITKEFSDIHKKEAR